MPLSFDYSNLSKNDLTTVNSQIFQRLKFLSKLDLSHNKLPEMFTISNSDLKSLTELNLKGNLLRNVKDEAFKQLPQLITL